MGIIIDHFTRSTSKIHWRHTVCVFGAVKSEPLKAKSLRLNRCDSHHVGLDVYTSEKLTWLAGKSPCSIGNTSSNQRFPSCHVSLRGCKGINHHEKFVKLPPKGQLFGETKFRAILGRWEKMVSIEDDSLENLVYHFFRQLWLVLGVKLMEINSNWFSRSFVLKWPRDVPLGGGNSNIFYLHPTYLGKWSNLTNILSNGLVQPPTRPFFWGETLRITGNP